jgi:protein TonB
VVRVRPSAAFAASAALHAVAFVLVARAPALAVAPPDYVKVEVVEVAPPALEPLPPPPLAIPLRRRLPREIPPDRPVDAPRPPSPTPEAPPPPNAPPPEDAPPPAKAPIRIGISMSSATEGGGVAAPAGNTLYGEAPRTAPEPSEVKPYRSDRYVPPTQVSALPKPLDACYRTAPEDYPEAARRLELEAAVKLALTIDETGAIVDVRVVDDPGHGFGAAAIAALKRNGCRFAPSRKDGAPVATSIVWTLRFQLP